MGGVSFIVTVYNKRNFLPRVLQALAAQTGEFSREYVFVDDGSTDNSLEYLRSATADWQHCKIIAQQNTGASAAMNVAVAAATQDYLKLVDADDILVPDATRWLLAALRSTKAVLAYGAGGSYDPLRPIEWPSAPSQPTYESVAAPVRPTIRGSTVNPSKMLMARADYLRIGGADETVCCQDYSLALPLARLGSFVRVRAVVMLAPTLAPGRLSDNHARELHDVTRALGNFVARHADLPAADKSYAVRRAAGRAMLWSRRHAKFKNAARFGLVSLAARLNFVRDHAQAIMSCCSAYPYDPAVPIASASSPAQARRPGRRR
ncbi:MAG: glycosyltransferase family 2 protein [Stellaceae bacterium]